MILRTFKDPTNVYLICDYIERHNIKPFHMVNEPLVCDIKIDNYTNTFETDGSLSIITEEEFIENDVFSEIPKEHYTILLLKNFTGKISGLISFKNSKFDLTDDYEFLYNIIEDNNLDYDVYDHFYEFRLELVIDKCEFTFLYKKDLKKLKYDIKNI
jgi:hypothetical protein